MSQLTNVMDGAPPPVTPALPFQFGYTFLVADYRAFLAARRQLYPIKGALWRWRYALVPAITLIVGGAMAWSDGVPLRRLLSTEVVLAFAPIIAGLVVCLVLVDLISDRVLTPWIFRRFAMANQPVDVVIDDEGLAWTSGGIRGSLLWSRFGRAVEAGNAMFLFISKVEAITLPRRAFASPEEFAALTLYAKEKVRG
jgi:hypothetical protein